jgi:hypothetical protein
VTEDWGALAPPQPPPDHPIHIRVDLPEWNAVVGTARSMRDVPHLLRAIADRWEAACPEDDSVAEPAAR